jgi:hypothetical protein
LETLIKKSILLDGCEVELHDFSDALSSWDNTLSIIEKVAGLSYGKDKVANPKKLYDLLLTESASGPSSVFEFIHGKADTHVIDDNVMENILKFSDFSPPEIEFGYFHGHLNLRTALENKIEIKPDKNWCKKNVFTFKLKIPLWMRSQLIRHRIASYMEISRRRVKTGFEFYKSDRDKQWNCIKKHDNNLIKMAIELYNWKISNDVPAEVARGVLPQNLMTEIWVQYVNNRYSWENFVNLRVELNKEKPHTQFETNRVAREMYKLLNI